MDKKSKIFKLIIVLLQSINVLSLIGIFIHFTFGEKILYGSGYGVACTLLVINIALLVFFICKLNTKIQKNKTLVIVSTVIIILGTVFLPVYFEDVGDAAVLAQKYTMYGFNYNRHESIF